MNALSGLYRKTFRLLGLATLVCGFAAADTMIAGKIDATRADYDAWSKEDSTIANTYFADLAVVELTGSNRQAQRDALYVDLFTDISLNGAEGARVDTVKELSPGSSAAVLERISSALPLNESALAVARPQSAEVPARRERK